MRNFRSPPIESPGVSLAPSAECGAHFRRAAATHAQLSPGDGGERQKARSLHRAAATSARLVALLGANPFQAAPLSTGRRNFVSEPISAEESAKSGAQSFEKADKRVRLVCAVVLVFLVRLALSRSAC